MDIDVTPLDNSKSHKEGVSRTYKGTMDAPIVACLGIEGFLVNIELHEGKQHCQSGTPQFLRETLKLAHRMTNHQLLIQQDKGPLRIRQLRTVIVNLILIAGHLTCHARKL